MSLAPGTLTVPVRFAALALVLTAAAARPAEPGPPPREARFDHNGYPLPPGAVARLGVPPGLGGFSWTAGWTADGARFAVVDWVGVTVFDAATGRELECQKIGTEGRSLYTPLSRDGRLLFFLNGRSGVLYDTVTTATYRFTLPAPFGDPDRKVYSLALSADCRFLAGVSAPASGPGVAWRYDLARDKFARLVNDRADLHSVRLSPDGRRIYATGGTQTPELTARDPATDKELWTVSLKGVGTLRAVSADGRRLAVSDGDGVRVYDSADGKLILSAPLDTATPQGLWGIDLAPDGSRLAVAVDHEVTVWDDAGKVRHRLPHAARLVAFSPDGKSLLTVSAYVQRWDLETGKPVYPVPILDRPVGAAHLHWSGDGKRLLTIWPGDRRGEERDWRPDLLAVWNVGTADTIWRRTSSSGILTAALDRTGSTARLVEAGLVYQIAPAGGPAPPTVVRLKVPADAHDITADFLADGRLLVFGLVGADVAVDVYDPAGRAAAGPRVPLLVGEPREQYPPRPSGLTHGLPGVLLRPPGRRVDLTTGRPLPALDTLGDVFIVQGPLVAGGSAMVAARVQINGAWYGSRVEGIIWDRLTGGQVARLPDRIPDWGLAALSADGRYLAYAAENAVDVIDLSRSDPAPGQRHRRPTGDVRALAFSLDGRRLATASTDGTVLIWEMPPTRPRLWEAAVADQLWARLGARDPREAWDTLWHLLDHPDRAVGLLKARLEPARAAKDTPELIAKLDHPKYAVREEAARRLAGRGETVEMDLLAAYRTATSAEQRERLENLLNKLDPAQPPAPEVLRGLRAVWLLERIATADAKRLLRTMAGGASGSRVTAEAKAALERLP